jgi:hypothetical protein
MRSYCDDLARHGRRTVWRTLNSLDEGVEASLRDAVEEPSRRDVERFGEDHDGEEAGCAVGALDLGDGGGVRPGVAREVPLGPVALGAEDLEVRGEVLLRAHPGSFRALTHKAKTYRQVLGYAADRS